MLAACRRVAAGAWKSKTDKSGTDYHLHRLDGSTPPPPAPPPTAAPPDRADADTLHRVYSALLAALPLSAAHREALRRRGLADAEIDGRGYGTLPIRGRAHIAADLRQRFGDAVLRVPGIVTRERDGRRYLTLAGAAGLLVPVRDTAGRIVALLVRRDDPPPAGTATPSTTAAATSAAAPSTLPPKYTYVSSGRHGGPSPGAPVHVPRGVTGPCRTVRVTEGALKADVAHALTGLPTVGLPGVSAWRPALPILREFGARTVRLSLDADAADKPPVARALAAIVEGLTVERLAVELERWPAPHKGIDDALAAGATVEVLTGDDARRAIAEIVAEGTAAEPLPPPSPLERLADVLAADGAEGLYRDAELLEALAQLAESDPAEYACRRARLQRAGIRLRDLDAALAPLRRKLRAAQPLPDAAGAYRVAGGRIVRDVPTRDGPVDTPLATWAGRIVEEVVTDDGAERSVTLAVEGALQDGTPLPRVEVLAADWPYMRWPVERWGTRAVVLAGAATADHLRCALQLLSGDVPRRTVYAHTGWREIGGRWLYLHAGGAIGAGGPASDVCVSLPDALAGYILPDPLDDPRGASRVWLAVRASLRVLDVAPDRITVPLLGAVYRAVLAPCDCALHLAGPTGAGKSETAALAQQHYGAAMDRLHLPGSWASTGNSLESLAFAAAHAVLVVDDFAPAGATGDVSRMHREADRLLRAQGNRAGRQRMRADATLRPAKPPRGIIISTGEDVPRGQSLRARMLTLELGPGELDWARLTDCQRDAAAGLYAQAMAGFLRWLAPQYPAIRDGLRARRRRCATVSTSRGCTRGRRASWRTWRPAGDTGSTTRWRSAPSVGRSRRRSTPAYGRRCRTLGRRRPNIRTRRSRAGTSCAYWLAPWHRAGRTWPTRAAADPPTRTHGAGARHRSSPATVRTPAGIRWAAVSAGSTTRDCSWSQRPPTRRRRPLPANRAIACLSHRGPSGSALRRRWLLVTWDAGRRRNTVRRRLAGHDRRSIALRGDALSTCTGPSKPSTDGAAPHKDRAAAVDGAVAATVHLDGATVQMPPTVQMDGAQIPRDSAARVALWTVWTVWTVVATYPLPAQTIAHRHRRRIRSCYDRTTGHALRPRFHAGRRGGPHSRGAGEPTNGRTAGRGSRPPGGATGRPRRVAVLVLDVPGFNAARCRRLAVLVLDLAAQFSRTPPPLAFDSWRCAVRCLRSARPSRPCGGLARRTGDTMSMRRRFPRDRAATFGTDGVAMRRTGTGRLVRFANALEARWARFFDLAGWTWQYRPRVDLADGWRPDFSVWFWCGHSECRPHGHTLLVAVRPYSRVEDFADHPCLKYPFGRGAGNERIPADAGAAFGVDPGVSYWEMTHGHGGGVYDVPWALDGDGDWRVMWAAAERPC